MTKHFFIFIFLITFSFSGNSQYYKREHVDSLSISLNSQEGIPRINTLLHLADSYCYFNIDTALTYANAAKNESTQYSYHWGYYKSIYCLTKALSDKTNLENIIPIIEQTSYWFEKNGYESDALHCQILYTSVMSKVKGSEASSVLAGATLERAIKLGDDRLLGRSWLLVQSYTGLGLNEVYPNSMDSARYYLSKTNDSTHLIIANIKDAYAQNGRREGHNVAKTSLRISKNWGNPYMICQAYSSWGLNFAGQRRTDSAAYCYKKQIEFSQKLGDKTFEQNAYKGLVYTYIVVDSLNLTLDYAQSGLKLSRELHSYSDESWILGMMGAVYSAQNNYKDGIKTAITLLDICKNLNDDYRLYSSQRLLGEMYVATEQYEKADSIFKKGIEWLNEGEENPQKIRSRGNLHLLTGQLNLQRKRYDDAIIYFELSFEDLHESGSNSIDPLVLIFKTHLNQGKINEAEEAYQQLLMQYPDHSGTSSAEFLLQEGRFLTSQGDFEKASLSLEKFLSRSEQVANSDDRGTAYLNLYQAYNALDKHEEALNAYVSFNTIDDSLKAGVQKDNVAKIQSDYELSLKETTIQDLRQQQELNDLRLDQQNQQLEVRQLYLILMGFMLVIVAGIGYWFFRRFRLKKKQEETQMRIERAELEVENLQSKQQAEIAEVKNTLFANVSHEFRTPLTLIKVPIKSYMDKIPEKDRPIFDGVLNNTDQLLKLIDELLDVSRMESGTMELQKSAFNLHHFFTHVKSYFAPLFEEKQIDFKWNYLLNPVQFDADENRMKIVLNNLLKNAYSHTPENGTVVCTVTASKAPGIKITVSNTGEGIKPENLPHIFERYFRGNEKDYTGNGIGLSLSKEIVEMHGGKISVEVSATNIVSFTIELPGTLNPIIDIESLSTKQAEVSSSATRINPQESTPISEKPTLLVVEDNLEIRNLLESTLAPEFEIITANDGEAGEKLALKHQPDIVLSDVMMPKKDGFELLGALKTNINSSHIPIVLLTAKVDAESKIIGLNQDADDYIAKPFNPQELIARLQNLIRQRKHLQKLFNQNPLVHVKGIKCSDIDDAFFTKARTILEKNYQNGDFSVSDFCGELTLNRNSVHNKVMAFTNDNTSRYIKNFRLEKSAQMLMETTIAISDIYLKNGFNSSQAFNKAFKERFKLTPTVFREEKRE